MLLIVVVVAYLLIGMVKVGMDLNRHPTDRPAILNGESMGGMLAEMLLWPIVTIAGGRF